MWVKDYVILESKRIELQEKMKPLQDEMSEVNSRIRDLNDKMPYGIKMVIQDKLWENTPDSVKEEIDDYHRKVSEMMSSGAYYAFNQKCPFDPRIDKWHLITFEQEGDKIRFQVSCYKNEGTISGLMTFLDTYWTTWFSISEIEHYY